MKNALFFTLLLFFSGLLTAQEIVYNQEGEAVIRCHTMEAREAMEARNPQMESLEDFEQWLNPLVREYKENIATQGDRAMVVTTVPIIFHVIHDNDAVGTGDNISATYINAQIDQLNNDFRKIAGTSGNNNNPVGADTEVEFCAAIVDSNGGTLAEPGINRINRNSMGWTAPPYGTCTGGFNDSYIEGTIKPQSQWNPDNYLNVWVMDINCGILGYAQFPSSSGLGGLNNNGGAANTDGVVLLTTSLGSTTTPNPQGAPYNQGRTGTHELGHFFGLRHIWGDGGCGVDDYCSDTPESDAANYGCPNHSSCGTTDMVENYMDYTDDSCMNVYTNDQKSRIQTVLTNSPRRGALGNSTACTGGGGCTSTVSSFPYNEGFESGFGDWTQGSGDDFDWSRTSGATPSSNTGPTSANEGSFYAFVESSSPNYSTKTTLLNSPCFDLNGESSATFSFDYHMYGAAAMGNLNLEARTEGGSWSSLWTVSGNLGNSWFTASVDLSSYVGNTIELRFNGTTGTTWQGDMAIDDLSLTTTGGGGGGCTGGIASFPYSEGWESNFGDWSQDATDDFDWSRTSGGTPSSNTGPVSASEGSFYAYCESSSPNYSNKTAILNGPCYDLSAESSANFSFDYHMYGAAAMGSLSLEAKPAGGSWTSVWSLAGNQGNSWQTASIDLGAYTGTSVELRYIGTTGTTWQGDMAIDKLSLSTSGGGGCSDITLTLVFDNYPEETSWEITNASGIVASGGTYGNQPDGSTLIEVSCLDDDCYTFTIFDVYGDGICCNYGNGSYLLQNSVGTTLASGGTFGASESTNFCISGGVRTGEDDLAILKETTTPILFADLHLFPNPVQDELNIRYHSKWEGHAELRIVDLMGRNIYQKTLNVEFGKNQIELETTDLQSGSYLFVIEKEGDLMTKRFVVIK